MNCVFNFILYEIYVYVICILFMFFIKYYLFHISNNTIKNDLRSNINHKEKLQV